MAAAAAAAQLDEVSGRIVVADAAGSTMVTFTRACGLCQPVGNGEYRAYRLQFRLPVAPNDVFVVTLTQAALRAAIDTRTRERAAPLPVQAPKWIRLRADICALDGTVVFTGTADAGPAAELTRFHYVLPATLAAHLMAYLTGARALAELPS